MWEEPNKPTTAGFINLKSKLNCLQSEQFFPMALLPWMSPESMGSVFFLFFSNASCRALKDYFHIDLCLPLWVHGDAF